MVETQIFFELFGFMGKDKRYRNVQKEKEILPLYGSTVPKKPLKPALWEVWENEHLVTHANISLSVEEM